MALDVSIGAASRDERRTSVAELEGADVGPVEAALAVVGACGPADPGCRICGLADVTGPIPTPEAIPGGVIVVGRGKAPGVGAAPEGDRRIASAAPDAGAGVTEAPDPGADATLEEVPVAPEGRARAAAPPAADRTDVAARRESAVAAARARRRSSRPEGAGRALDPGGSVAAEGARSPGTADDARPGPPSFPGRAGGPAARVAGVRITRASELIVIFPADLTSSETRTGIVVGARRAVVAPGR